MRAFKWIVSLYLVVAVTTRIAEARGITRCECDPECWCKRPLLSTFRWVFPFGHHARDHTSGVT